VTGEEDEVLAFCGSCPRRRVDDPSITAEQRMRRCPGLDEADRDGSAHVPMGAPAHVCDGVEVCSGALGRLPVAVEAFRAWQWWDRAQLRELYPDGIPTVIREAVDAVEADSADWRAERARRLAPKRT
jgi:hypothetical protein